LGIEIKLLVVIPLVSVLLLSLVLNSSFAQPTITPKVGDFRCYDIEEPIGIQGISVLLTDQFGEEGFVVEEPIDWCNPTNKTGTNEFPGFNNTDSQFPNQHYRIYNITDGIAPLVEVELEDQFGISRHIVGDPIELWVPSDKRSFNGTNEFFPINPLNDIHFKCYEITPTPFPFPSLVTVDQFLRLGFNGSLIDAFKMCTPVKKTLTTGQMSGDEDIPDHLKCYSTKITIPFNIVFAIEANDQFLGSQHILNDIDYSCFFAEKRIILERPVGGDLIPLDTTMVLVAGTHSAAAWMIPVIVSAIGIGIVIARKF